jgi:hypothetical protein
MFIIGGQADISVTTIAGLPGASLNFFYLAGKTS